MIIGVQTVGPLQENAWILADESSGQAILVDPGDEPERLLQAVDATGCVLREIWLTHAHVDHVGAIAPIVRSRPVPVFLHPADDYFYGNAPDIGRMYGMQIETLPRPTRDLAQGDVLSLGDTKFTVWHLPGHAPGHVAFISEGLCVSGDLLFEGSMGRTDLPLSDPKAMHGSLRRLSALPEETHVLPGHGGRTTIGRELATNPFLKGVARPIGA